jgi:hypothetical protein
MAAPLLIVRKPEDAHFFFPFPFPFTLFGSAAVPLLYGAEGVGARVGTGISGPESLDVADPASSVLEGESSEALGWPSGAAEEGVEEPASWVLEGFAVWRGVG